jgi:hypothetical protein
MIFLSLFLSDVPMQLAIARVQLAPVQNPAHIITKPILPPYALRQVAPVAGSLKHSGRQLLLGTRVAVRCCATYSGASGAVALVALTDVRGNPKRVGTSAGRSVVTARSLRCWLVALRSFALACTDLKQVLTNSGFRTCIIRLSYYKKLHSQLFLLRGRMPVCQHGRSAHAARHTCCPACS